jgi:hypothetical protein
MFYHDLTLIDEDEEHGILPLQIHFGFSEWAPSDLILAWNIISVIASVYDSARPVNFPANLFPANIRNFRYAA